MKSLVNNFRVAALPMPIVWADKEANMRIVEQAFARLPQGTDLVVLPELFSTGFADDFELIADLAERNTGPTIDRVKSWAARYGVAIAGSFIASTPPHLYNRGFFIEPSGEETFYDKRHLFSVGREGAIFHPGTTPMNIVRFRGWNIALIICYDLRFPVWCRCVDNRYDLMLVIASWPRSRGYAFEHLLVARAIENQCTVVGCDRGGSDEFGQYDGLTQIYDSHGMPVGTEEEPCVVADLSLNKVQAYRESFPVSRDADDFTIIDR